jgi:hypothetical protein
MSEPMRSAIGGIVKELPQGFKARAHGLGGFLLDGTAVALF